MHRGIVALGLLVGVCASPVAAIDWDSVAGWDVHEIDATRCVVGRAFAGTETTFGIIMALDGEVRVFATGAGWATRAGQPAAAEVALDGRRLAAGPAVGIEQMNNRGFVAAAPAGFLASFAGAQQLGLHAGPGSDQIAVPLTGTAAGLAQGRRCLDHLRNEAGARVATAPAPRPRTQAPVIRNAFASAIPSARAPAGPFVRAIASGPVPRGSKASWMQDAEYPSAALRAEEEGSVTIRLAVASSGEVSTCEVVKSSGSRVLDAETCRVVKRRARYTPARDAAGQAVASVDQHSVRWALPR